MSNKKKLQRAELITAGVEIAMRVASLHGDTKLTRDLRVELSKQDSGESKLEDAYTDFYGKMLQNYEQGGDNSMVKEGASNFVSKMKNKFAMHVLSSFGSEVTKKVTAASNSNGKASLRGHDDVLKFAAPAADVNKAAKLLEEIRSDELQDTAEQILFFAFTAAFKVGKDSGLTDGQITIALKKASGSFRRAATLMGDNFEEDLHLRNKNTDGHFIL